MLFLSVYTVNLSFVFPFLLHTIDAVHANFLTWSFVIWVRSLLNTVFDESCIWYCDETHGNKRSIRNVRRDNLMAHQRFINEQPCSARCNEAIHSFLEKPQSWSRRDLLRTYWLEYDSDFLASFSAHTGGGELSWVGISTFQRLQRSGTILFSKARSLLVSSHFL